MSEEARRYLESVRATYIEAEEWKPVTGCYGLRYQVSNLGRIRRAVKGGFKILRCTIHGGYRRVKLCLMNSVRRVFLHVVVAEEFLGFRTDGVEVNHKDGNKLNCAASNLEYVTRSENALHAFETGLRGNSVGSDSCRAKLNERDVIDIRALHAKGLKTLKEIASQFRVSRACVEAAVYRKTWRHI